MELVTIEDLETQLVDVSDPVERRRLRSRIRRMRRREGVSMTRVGSPRRGTRNPLEAESRDEAVARLHAELRPLLKYKPHAHVKRMYATPLHVRGPSVLARFKERFGHDATQYAFYEQEEGSLLLIGPIV